MGISIRSRAAALSLLLASGGASGLVLAQDRPAGDPGAPAGASGSAAPAVSALPAGTSSAAGAASTSPPARTGSSPVTVLTQDGMRLEGRLVSAIPGLEIVIVVGTEERRIPWSDVLQVNVTGGAAAGSDAGKDELLLRGVVTPLRGVLVKRTPDFVVFDLATGNRLLLAPSLVDSVRPAALPPPAAPVAVVAAPTGATATVALEDSEQKRQAWKQRGGVLPSFEFLGQATAIFGDVSGYGGGGTGKVGFMAVSMPDPTTGSTTWGGLRMAVGYGWSYLSAEGASVQIASLPMNLGGVLGVGGFSGGKGWRGLVLGLAWAPSFASTKVKGQDPTGRFNYAGGELTFDITSVDAVLDKNTKEAHVRISAFLLPPIGGTGIWVANLGFGAVLY